MAHERGESDWGDWLPQAVASATPETVAVWYLGCNGFVLKADDGTTVLVDPYLGLGDPPRTVRMLPVPFDPSDVAAADAVFATHEHSDHVHGPTQAPILAGTGADYVAPDASLDAVGDEDWWAEWGVERSQFTEVSEGDRLDVGAFTVHVEPAHDPDASHPVSYVFEHEAGTIDHGGDGRPDPVLEEVGGRHDIDLGILALGAVGRIPDKQTREPTRTKWYSDENEVVRAANQLRLERLLPSHWDIWKGLTADPTVLHHHARSFDYPVRLDVAEVGDCVDL